MEYITLLTNQNHTDEIQDLITWVIIADICCQWHSEIALSFWCKIYELH